MQFIRAQYHPEDTCQMQKYNKRFRFSVMQGKFNHALNSLELKSVGHWKVNQFVSDARINAELI